LDSVSKDRFQDGFVEQEFVAEGEPLLTAKQPMHFHEGGSNLFSFGEDVVAPSESPIKVEPKILVLNKV
jgi:hypothetical protein